jgi:AcrR family transcriptional regulator
MRRGSPLIKGWSVVNVENLDPGLHEGAGRKRRADGERNRERLVETAKAAFAELGADVSLDEIARRAGVGIGTLYRHFPTRGAIVEAVYRREVEQLAGSATRLLASLPPAEALHAWMRLFVDYIATKKVIAAALGAMVEGAAELYVSSRQQISDAVTQLVERAAAAGEIRGDVDPGDLLRALVGFTYGNANPGWQASALRLIDILMDGLRPAAPPRN